MALLPYVQRIAKSHRVTWLLYVITQQAMAQFQPIQLTTQLTPPYSVYLADYATPGNEKLRLIMLQRDLTKPSYQVRLQMAIELNGRVIMRTARAFNPPPITLDPGVPMIISGADLQPYLDSYNIEFTGYSRQEYEHTKALPEGSYQICFTAYDYRRPDVPVSDLQNCSFFWLAKSEPPLINFPACGTGVALKDPQQIVFSWLPRNTTSPQSSAETEYELALYEMRPEGRNPNDVVLSSQPIYRTVTGMTEFSFGPAEPILIQNLSYAWRVRAIDKNGRDQFRNNGYSEVCTFIYGIANAVDWQPIKELSAEGESESRGKVWWETQQVDGYKVHYKKVGSSYQWFSSEIDKPEALLFDLEADTRYEARVQPRMGAAYGPYSDIKEFRTRSPRTFECGQAPDNALTEDKPLLFATVGMTIDVHGIIMTIKDVNAPNADGIYNGLGEVSIPYFGGAAFHVTFNDLHINEKRIATQGRIDFLTRGVEAMIEEQLADQKIREREEHQERNREAWAGTDFYDKIFYYDEVVIKSMQVDGEGNLMIEDENGHTYVNKDIKSILADAPEKAVIIEDKNGDQWVVQKDGKITRVPAGGLSPDMNVRVSEEALDYVKRALQELHTEYSGENFAGIQRELDQRKAALDDHIKGYNATILGNISSPSMSTSPPSTQGDMTSNGSLFFDFEEVESPDATDDEFKDLSLAKNQKERERNRGAILSLLGNDENVEEAKKLVAPELEIESRTVSQYLEKEKQENTSEEKILTAVKDAVVRLIDTLLINAAKKK